MCLWSVCIKISPQKKAGEITKHVWLCVKVLLMYCCLGQCKLECQAYVYNDSSLSRKYHTGHLHLFCGFGCKIVNWIPSFRNYVNFLSSPKWLRSYINVKSSQSWFFCLRSYRSTWIFFCYHDTDPCKAFVLLSPKPLEFFFSSTVCNRVTVI